MLRDGAHCGGLRLDVPDRKEMRYTDENLGTYWECLLGQQQKRDFTKEAYGRANVGMRFLDDESYEDLRTTNGHAKLNKESKFIQNIFSYDMLRNPIYADAF